MPAGLAAAAHARVPATVARCCGHARVRRGLHLPAAKQRAAWSPQLLAHHARRAHAPQPANAQAGVQAAQAHSAGDSDPGSMNGSSLAASAEAALQVNGSGGIDAAAALQQQHQQQDQQQQHAVAIGSPAGLGHLQQPQQQQQQQPSQPSSPEPGSPRKSSGNFAKRVVSGVLLGAAGAAIIAYGRLPFLATTLFVVFHATREYFGFLTSQGISKGTEPPPPSVSAATTALCIAIAALPHAAGIKSGTALCVAAFVLLAVNVIANRRPTFSQLTSSVFGLFYCGYLPCFWVKLRNLALPAPAVQLPALASLLPPLTVGFVATLTTVCCIIAADTGAYFVGKNLGRTKLTDISPKKTVEGALGGMASAVAAALALRWALGWPGDAAAAAGYGVLMFFSSIFGDLIESIMKREAGMKDSGDLIPGHGGLLDRFDSYMFSGALAWFYLTTLLPRFGLPLPVA